MSEKTLYLNIMTPDKNLFSGSVRDVYLPGAGGEIGILPGHAPLVTEMGVGTVTVTAADDAGTKRRFFCSGGFAEVMAGDVSVLADIAESDIEVDADRACLSLERAEKRISSNSPEIDYARSVASLQRALARLSVSKAAKGA